MSPGRLECRRDQRQVTVEAAFCEGGKSADDLQRSLVIAAGECEAQQVVRVAVRGRLSAGVLAEKIILLGGCQ